MCIFFLYKPQVKKQVFFVLCTYSIFISFWGHSILMDKYKWIEMQNTRSSGICSDHKQTVQHRTCCCTPPVTTRPFYFSTPPPMGVEICSILQFCVLCLFLVLCCFTNLLLSDHQLTHSIYCLMLNRTKKVLVWDWKWLWDFKMQGPHEKFQKHS